MFCPTACNTQNDLHDERPKPDELFHPAVLQPGPVEIRDVADQMYRLVYAAAPKLFQNAGPSCVRGACSEGKMSCGKMREVRERFAAMREQCHGKG